MFQNNKNHQTHSNHKSSSHYLSNPITQFTTNHKHVAISTNTSNNSNSSSKQSKLIYATSSVPFSFNKSIKRSLNKNKPSKGSSSLSHSLLEKNHHHHHSRSHKYQHHTSPREISANSSLATFNTIDKDIPDMDNNNDNKKKNKKKSSTNKGRRRGKKGKGFEMNITHSENSCIEGNTQIQVLAEDIECSDEAYSSECCSVSVEVNAKEWDNTSSVKCSICFEPFEGSMCSIDCGHNFCYECISKWTCYYRANCPLCKAKATFIEKKQEGVLVKEKIIIHEENKFEDNFENSSTNPLECFDKETLIEEIQMVLNESQRIHNSLRRINATYSSNYKYSSKSKKQHEHVWLQVQDTKNQLNSMLGELHAGLQPDGFYVMSNLQVLSQKLGRIEQEGILANNNYFHPNRNVSDEEESHYDHYLVDDENYEDVDDEDDDDYCFEVEENHYETRYSYKGTF